jgi:hypothetical protein
MKTDFDTNYTNYHELSRMSDFAALIRQALVKRSARVSLAVVGALANHIGA